MRILEYAFRNIIRNPFLSISSIFVVTLLIFFVNILLGILFTSRMFIESVNNRISFTISFQSGYTTSDIRVRSLADKLQTAFTGISLETISKREAFALLKERNPDLTALIENSWENPLPDSLRVDNIPLDQYDTFNAIVESEKDILFYDKDAMNRKYLDYQSQFQRVSFVVKFLNIIEYGVYALLSLFVFTVAVIVYTVIGNSIFFHKHEIEIIELVGGRSLFIYWPFLLQGWLYSFIGTSIALSALMFLSAFSPGDFVSGPLSSLHAILDLKLQAAIPYELFLFFLLWFGSAFIAVRKYVKV